MEGLKKADADRQKGFLEMFPGVKDVDAVLGLTPEEFLARIVTGTDDGQLFRGPATEVTVILGVVPAGNLIGMTSRHPQSLLEGQPPRQSSGGQRRDGRVPG